MCVYRFGPFTLRAKERLLLRGQELVPLSPKAFYTLLVLIENSGHLVEKNELLKRVWPDTFVEESNLTNNISILRKALGEGPGKRRYIQTIPKRGYRFVAEVRKVHEHDAESERRQPLASSLYRRPEDEIPATEPGIELSASEGIAGWGDREEPTSSRASGFRTIAVLPFKIIGSDGGDEPLGFGMTDALITRLCNVKRIIVRPTSAVLKYNSPEQNPVEIGRELKVETVLDGYIQKVGERVRVTVQLISVRDGASFWAEKFEEQLTDIFSAQDHVSERVASALTLKLTGRERELLTKRYTENTEAYRAYLKGRNLCDSRIREDLLKSLEYFEQAIEIDPDYALAYSGLTYSYILLYSYDYMPPGDAVLKARAAALEALEIDDSLSEGHALMGTIKWYYDRDWRGAEREYEKALSLNPNCARSHQFYSFYLNTMMRFDEALEQIRFAYHLDPVSPVINAGLGVPYFFRSQYGRAIEMFRKAIDMEPTFWLAHTFLGEAYSQTGQHEKAIAELQKASQLGHSPWVLAKLGQVYAASGNRDEAQKMIDEMARLSIDNYISPYLTAVIYSSLGEKEKACQYLFKAYEERTAWMVYLKVDKAFYGLRSDHQFDQLLDLMGLPA